MKSSFVSIGNGMPLAQSAVPLLEVTAWQQTVINHCLKENARIVALLGERKADHAVRVYALVGIDQRKTLLVGATDIAAPHFAYPAITPQLPEAHLFERELHEDFGITPEGHPWLKPVRHHTKEYSFASVEGDGIHEVAVGPVHAGIIEPGHFRFQCHGETVHHLEIRLGYQHRGVEKLMVHTEQRRRAPLAESIAGDTVIGHGLAYSQAMEGLADIATVPRRAHHLRGIVLELERLANHVGDLGAIANDIGFLPATAYFGRLRGEFLNMLLELTGNRYGRSFVRPGGVLMDIPPTMIVDFRNRLSRAYHEIKSLAEFFFETSSVLARLESTGVVSPEWAKRLGLVGMAARASHVVRDVRHDYPCGVYRATPLPVVSLAAGDVFARTRLRSLESKRSLEYTMNLLDTLPAGKISEPCASPRPASLVASLVEGWRGEIAHVVLTNDEGTIARYKIVDPSFHNWMAVAVAMRGGQISDFPLCNKSFNLSYAGHDL